jgi:hypothetical protein
MIQQGQAFKLKAKGRDGQPLWAYRYCDDQARQALGSRWRRSRRRQWSSVRVRCVGQVAPAAAAGSQISCHV